MVQWDFSVIYVFICSLSIRRFLWNPLTPLLPMANGRFNIHSSLSCASPPPLLFSPFQHYEALQKYLNTLRIFYHSILHRSITHPLSPALSHSQSFILTSSRFDSAICLLLRLWYTPSLPPLCSLYFPRWKQPFLLPPGKGREIIFC